MTAISLFIARGRSHIIADRAQYHDDGTILGIRPKLVIDQRLRIAVAVNGNVVGTTGEDLAAWLGGCSSLSEVVRSAPAFVAGAHAELSKLIASPATANGHARTVVQLFMAAFDIDRHAPTSFIVGSDQGTFGPGYEPLTVRRVRQVVSPPVEPGLAPGADDFDPIAGGRRLIEAQRQIPDDRGIYRIGGGADLASVGPQGVGVCELVQWPDEIGKRLRPLSTQPPAS